MMKISDQGRNQQYSKSRNIRFNQQQRNQYQNNAAPWNNEIVKSTPYYMLDQQQQYQNNFHQTMDFFQSQVPKTIFTLHCGEIRPRDEGTRVKISGKVVKRPRTGRFLEIKDRNGCTQLVATNDKPEISQNFLTIPADSYITVIGKVQLRPHNFINNVRIISSVLHLVISFSNFQSITTGACEIAVEEICRVAMPISPLKETSDPFSQQQRSYSTSSTSRGITSIEYKRCPSENIVQYFVNRETTCGELRKEDVGRTVTLVGWLDSKKHGKFLQLKDGYGITQILVDSDELSIRQEVANVREDSIVMVKGRVIARPPMMVRTNSETGEIEVFVVEFKILDPKEEYVKLAGEVGKESRMEVDIFQTEQQSTQQIPPKVVEKPRTNLYTYRTHHCGELNESNIGQEVTLTGWLEFQRMRKFFTLRDGYGCTQVVIPDELSNQYNIDKISFESVLKVNGVVLARPVGMKNESMITGSIEVMMKSFEVLNESKKSLPIELRTFNRSKENLRLEYRYLDLRFSDMQKNLRMRSKVLMKMREYLINHCGFVEVETPTLFRRTPGGAQEFVVPSQKAGKFYSLVQSPQQFKQMLMVGSIDRYFQIARCYRDEATRPDRQPEFTQLDIELSFTDRESIMSLVEAILVNCWPENNGTLSTPFQRMTYKAAMENYGTDKPDLRYDYQIKNVSSLVALNEDLAQSTPDFASYVFVLKHPQSNIKNQVKKELKELTNNYCVQMVVSKITVESIMDWIDGPLKNLFSSVVLKALAANLHLEPNDLLVLSYGKKSDCVSFLKYIRR